MTITGFDGTPTGALVIPATINGYPVKTIGYGAFNACSGLTSVTIPDSVTSIGERAFSGCSGLTSVTIGNGVTSIGDLAFNNCPNVAEVHISDLTAWCGISFDGSYSNPCSFADRCSLILNGEEITELVIPPGVTSIGSQSFFGCSGLTSVSIPDGVTSIGSAAFIRCSQLTSITIPDSVTSVGVSAFLACSNLAKISIPASLQGQTSGWGLPSTCQIIVRN